MTALSVLDLSPVTGDGTQAAAIRDTIEVGVAAERLGYNRIWFAEHHSMGTISSATPEILIAALTQRTRTIRLGSGGVMLPDAVGHQAVSIVNSGPIGGLAVACASRRAS